MPVDLRLSADQGVVLWIIGVNVLIADCMLLVQTGRVRRRVVSVTCDCGRVEVTAATR